MDKKEILEDNKLIAEFMGAKMIVSDYHDINIIQFPDGSTRDLHGLKYHSSWDWLMPVVEKIENIDIRNNGYDFSKVKFQGDFCEIFAYATYRGTSFYWKKWYSISGTFHNHKNQSETKIEAVYLSVIEFIKWYNKNIKK